MDADWNTDKDGIFARYFEVLDELQRTNFSRALRLGEVVFLMKATVALKWAKMDTAAASVLDIVQVQIEKIPDEETELLNEILGTVKASVDCMYGAGVAEEMLADIDVEAETRRGKAN